MSAGGKASANRPGRRPRATCRLQFRAEFGFPEAVGILDYLNQLGISDVYASPLFPACPGSPHGYDVCSFEAANSSLGGDAGFEKLSGQLEERGMGLLLDMVPNHMAAAEHNAWWQDVLEKGRASAYSEFFDIDWDWHNGRVLLPVLGGHYHAVLERGELRLVCDGGRFQVQYFDRKFPLSPRSYHALLTEMRSGPGALTEAPGFARPLKRLLKLSASIGCEPKFDQSEFAALQNGLGELSQASGDFRKILQQGLESWSDPKRTPLEKLHRLLEMQNYRFCFWRTGLEEINYRRFFDVADLAALRMELPEVFDASHAAALRWIESGRVTGLRIDHPDGLAEPGKYFERLRARAGRSLYVVAEKILTAGEQLRRDWPIQGTTGYDFLNQLNGIFVDDRAEGRFTGFFERFTGGEPSFREVSRQSRKTILNASFAADLDSLAVCAKGVAAGTLAGHDLTLRQIREALGEVIASFPVYRTYLGGADSETDAEDAARLDEAVRDARGRRPGLDSQAFDFVRSLFGDELLGRDDSELRRQQRTFLRKFQQLTSPVMAKGVEDTAFYRYTRLLSLNEVGGDPGKFGTTVEEFHNFNQRQARDWPDTMTATATHDTKRGEDNRARLNVLSEMPEAWAEAVTRWARLNADKKEPVNGVPAPGANDEYLLYQTLIGSWPEVPSLAGRSPAAGGAAVDGAYQTRVTSYLRKAIREAKVHTSWIDPNEGYETAAENFARRILDFNKSGAFLADFRKLQRKAGWFGQINSLAQVMLKAAAPGAPDFFQGAELWDFSLVDPDNRRPVDFGIRRKLLAETQRDWREDKAALLRRLLAESSAGALKMLVTWRALELRRKFPDLFARGGYLPLEIRGPRKDHVCAFLRQWRGQRVAVIAPRLPLILLKGAEKLPTGAAVWRDTEAAFPERQGGELENALTGESNFLTQAGTLSISEALRHFPVALLIGRESRSSRQRRRNHV